MVEFDSDGYVVRSITQTAQNAYLDAALQSIERGAPGIHPHDTFEIAVRHNVLPEASTAACFIAIGEANRIRRDLAYFPDELPKGWIDEL